MRDWAGPLGSCVLYFSFRTDPSHSAGPGVVPFARLFTFLPSRRPPHSVRGHGLGNRAAKQRHGTGFPGSFFFCVVLPTPSSAPSRGGGQGNLGTHSGTGLYVLSSFICDARCFVFSFDVRSRLAIPPPIAGLWVVPPFHFVWVFAFRLVPPAAMISLQEGFDCGFPCLRACVLLQFACIRLAPPRHADDAREGYDGGWSCHSAFFVSPPRHTGGTRQVLTDGLPSYSVCVSFNYFVRVFVASTPGRLEVWEWVLRSRIYDSWSKKGNRGFHEFPIFLHMRLIRVG